MAIGPLARARAGIGAEPSGWVWAKTVPSVLTKAAWPAMPKVGLHVLCGGAGGRQEAEVELVGGSGGQGGGGRVPLHGIAVGEAVGVAEWAGGKGLREGLGVVFGEGGGG